MFVPFLLIPFLLDFFFTRGFFLIQESSVTEMVQKSRRSKAGASNKNKGLLNSVPQENDSSNSSSSSSSNSSSSSSSGSSARPSN
jgi:hypothetical protein